jgi:hypothetical protein
MNKKLLLNLGIVLNNNGHTLITRIRKNRFGWRGMGGRHNDGIDYIVVEPHQGLYIYGFYRYTYKDPKDILLNFTPENMLFYYAVTDTSFDEYLASRGVNYLTKVKWDPKMAPSIIYQGGNFANNVSYAVSENGDVYEPADKVKHWTTTGFGSMARFCCSLNDFLDQNEFKLLNPNKASYWGDAFYNPKDYEGLN